MTTVMEGFLFPELLQKTQDEKGDRSMLKNSNSVIIKFEFTSEQTVRDIKKIVGLVKAKYMVSIIDTLNLDANPRSSKTGIVTDDIQESIETDPYVFPFKTKGILLASSGYEYLERGRIKITPENLEVEGILDGGHNTLAIGLYILKSALNYAGESMPRGSKTWDQFKTLWKENRSLVEVYLEQLRKEPDDNNLNFYVPVEMLVPRDASDLACVDNFKRELLDICAARNNNVQLQITAKSNQRGYFDVLRALMEKENPAICDRIEWKTNDGGDIKAQDLIALAWIPLQLISSVKDENGRVIEPVSPQKIYSAKGSCLKQFEKLMSSPDVTADTSKDYKCELKNSEVCSAFEITVQLPALYDYIYEKFPELYNQAEGKYGRITSVAKLNEGRSKKVAPFSNKVISCLNPEGFIVPLVYGLLALMENKEVNGYNRIEWTVDPLPFLEEHLDAIVKNYKGIIGMCDYDPQKIGKNAQSYTQALTSFKMALVGII